MVAKRKMVVAEVQQAKTKIDMTEFMDQQEQMVAMVLLGSSREEEEEEEEEEGKKTK